jgi:hypothetical protein
VARALIAALGLPDVREALADALREAMADPSVAHHDDRDA